MVKTASTMLPLGTKAPEFSLTDTVTGKPVSLADVSGGKGLLVMFICNHCPFVKHLRSALATFGKDYQAKGLKIVAISSNDATAYPDDGPEKMQAEAASAGYTFPYLFDGTQEVAMAYKAACTPDFFLFDANLALVYRGQFDSSRPGNGQPVTGADLRSAADRVLACEPPLIEQRASIGCNIKWKAGQEPAYFTGQSAVE
ncbi:redoxin domain-containing protein [bacterium]|nr:redoxin domain-containing protein [bacterium]